MSENNSVGTGIRSKCDLGMYQAGDSVILWYVNVCTSSSSGFCATSVQDFLSIPLVHVMLNDLLLRVLLCYCIFPCFYSSRLWNFRIHCVFFCPAFAVDSAFWICLLMCNWTVLKKYSIGISLIYHSILLISISLSSLLTFFTYFTILYLVFAVHQDWRIKSLTEV